MANIVFNKLVVFCDADTDWVDENVELYKKWIYENEKEFGVWYSEMVVEIKGKELILRVPSPFDPIFEAIRKFPFKHIAGKLYYESVDNNVSGIFDIERWDGVDGEYGAYPINGNK